MDAHVTTSHNHVYNSTIVLVQCQHKHRSRHYAHLYPVLHIIRNATTLRRPSACPPSNHSLPHCSLPAHLGRNKSVIGEESETRAMPCIPYYRRLLQSLESRKRRRKENRPHEEKRKQKTKAEKKAQQTDIQPKRLATRPSLNSVMLTLVSQTAHVL
ncbi:hypothetical protein CCMA1212_005508 [Trichoderma ghanense]|uniref:Uncharacterized protein n=1 Tax=Trichoderma ghanense TaxID=65468 RepID=A0ABY2H3E8_9HYPO